MAEGEATVRNVPETSNRKSSLLHLHCGIPLWCRPWPLLGKAPPGAQDFIQASLGHVHMNVHGTVRPLLASPDVQFRPTLSLV